MIEYRTSEYFNNEDYYLLFNPTTLLYCISKLHFDKGYWWSNLSQKFKMITIPCINCNELNNIKLLK